MNKQEQEAFEKKALDQLLSGKSLFGKEGAFEELRISFSRECIATVIHTNLLLILIFLGLKATLQKNNFNILPFDKVLKRANEFFTLLCL
jgi:hypothetical protein